MRYSLVVIVALLTAGPAVAQTSGDTEPSPTGERQNQRSEAQIRYDCQAEADRRLRQEPAVASGQTLYMPGVRAEFLRTCLRRHGLVE